MDAFEQVSPPVATKRHTNIEVCSPPSCQNKKPTDTTEEGIAPSIVSKTHTDSTERFPSRRVRAHINTTGGFLPPAVLPTDTTEQGFPSSVASKIPHRRTERFPSKAQINTTGGFLPPAMLPIDTTEKGKPFSIASKTHTDERRGFPPRCVKAHMNTTGRRNPPGRVGNEPTDTTEKGFPFSCIKNPHRRDGEVSLPVASKPTQIRWGGFLPLRPVKKRTHRRGGNPSPLHRKPCRREEPTEEGKPPPVFLCWNM